MEKRKELFSLPCKVKGNVILLIEVAQFLLGMSNTYRNEITTGEKIELRHRTERFSQIIESKKILQECLPDKEALISDLMMNVRKGTLEEIEITFKNKSVVVTAITNCADLAISLLS